jgi:hypothetical protein
MENSVGSQQLWKKVSLHFHTAECASGSKILGGKLNCTLQIGNNGWKDQATMEHSNYSSVASDTNIKA